MPSDWNKIIKSIRENWEEDFSGIIITHGTDTLSYVSSALSQYFSNFTKPIVIVSSDKPLNNKKSYTIVTLHKIDKPITKRPAETRMGYGKGAVDTWVAKINPGRVLYEIDGVPEEIANNAMRLASYKLSIKNVEFETKSIKSFWL